MTKLRRMFRLTEFSKRFTEIPINEYFDWERRKARKMLDLPAENFHTKITSINLYLKDMTKKGLWTSDSEVAKKDAWRMSSGDTKHKYKERAKQLRNGEQKQQIVDFEQNKLPQLLSDPAQFYWLLSVSFNFYRSG